MTKKDSSNSDFNCTVFDILPKKQLENTIYCAPPVHNNQSCIEAILEKYGDYS